MRILDSQRSRAPRSMSGCMCVDLSMHRLESNQKDDPCRMRKSRHKVSGRFAALDEAETTETQVMVAEHA